MGREARIALFLLLVISALAFAETTVKDCFAQEKPVSFWENGNYIASNSNIDKLVVLNYYHLSFDDTVKDDEWNISVMNGSEFLSALPENERPGFAEVAQLLNNISRTRNSSEESAITAHQYATDGFGAMMELGGFGASLIYSVVFAPLTQIKSLPDALKEKFDAARSILIDYLNAYPKYFWTALSGSSRMFVDANTAGRIAAAKVDGQMAILQEAGAGENYYHGAAKRVFVDARNLREDFGFCGRQQRGAKAVLDYFNSSPQLPHLLPKNLSIYLEYTAGKANDSSLAILAGNYLALKEAYADMQSEYEAARENATGEKEALRSAVTMAEAEQLGSLTDLPEQETNGSVVVGASSSGLVPELMNVKGQIADVEGAIARAKKYRDEGKESYLANAIMNAESAATVARINAGTVGNIIKNAKKYEEREREAARAAIADAEAMLATPLPTGSADAKVEAAKEIASAKKLFASARDGLTIGKRYEYYQRAMLTAIGAQNIMKGGMLRPMKQKAEQTLADLKKFLDNAEKDEVDVEYERRMLADANVALANTNSSENFTIIMAHAAELKRSVWQRLEAKYSVLEEKYATLAEAVLSIREVDARFLPGFEGVKDAFIGGKLDIGSKVGELKALGVRLESLNAQVQEATPQKLSEILSKNAKAVATHDQFIIGQPSRYRLDIYTRNPAPVAYAKAITFRVETEIPVYSVDGSSGDAITDAYPDGKTAVITVPAVSANQEFHFIFEKQDMPAQVTSSSRSCKDADMNNAVETATVGFFASRRLESLIAQNSAPDGTASARISYRGTGYSAQLAPADSGMTATGTVNGVANGANSLDFDFGVKNPFTVFVKNRSARGIGGGVTKVSYVAQVSGQALECERAEVQIQELYSGIADYSVLALSDEKLTLRAPAEVGSSSALSFSFSPLRTDAPQEFVVEFTIRNATAALTEAIGNAEAAARLFNRTSDLEIVEDAKRLAALNRTDDALAILTGLENSQKKISTADYSRFVSENSSAEGLVSSALATQTQLAEQKLTFASAQLATLVSALQAGGAKADSYAQAGQYKQATDSLRSATSAYRTGLASISWKSSAQAADDYAKARKTAQGGRTAELSDIERLVSLSQKQFSAGEQLESFLSSSLASQKLLALQSVFEQDAQGAKYEVQRIASDFAELQKRAEDELAAYSSQYSALTTQSKRKMPVAPADAQKAIQDAAREVQKAAGVKEATAETLLSANKSYSSLQAMLGKIRGGISSLQGTANASLGMARIALSEARQKSAPEDAADLAAIEKEINRADSLISDSLYADALASSDRALSAASLFVQKKSGQGGIEPKTIALGAVSLLFIAGAAYYFWQGRERKEKPERKKEIPKAE